MSEWLAAWAITRVQDLVKGVLSDEGGGDIRYRLVSHLGDS